MKKHSFLFILLIPITLLFSLLTTQHLYGATDQPEPVLKSIKYISITAEHEQVTFLFDSSSTTRIFTFNGERPRIIIDFPKVVPALTVVNTINTDGNLVARIRMGIHKGDRAKTRIVLDLAPNMEISYKRTIDKGNNSLILSVYKTGSEPELPQIEPVRTDKETKEEETKEKIPEKSEKNQGVKEKLQEPLPHPVPLVKTDPETAKTIKQAVPAEPVEPEKYAKPAEQETALPPVLQSISFDNSTGQGEVIKFQLSGFYPPKISVIEKGAPRVVCDFKNTILAASVTDIINPDSQFIKSIRVGKHTNPDKIRVVIDLKPDNNYDLRQIFFKEDEKFVLIINSTGK